MGYLLFFKLRAFSTSEVLDFAHRLEKFNLRKCYLSNTINLFADSSPFMCLTDLLALMG